MTKTVDFYYDYGSPTAYLAWTQLPAICEKHNATLKYKPILLGGVFKGTDNQSPVMIRPKGKWLLDDVTRYAKYYGVPYVMNPHFIVNTMPAMRGAMWAQASGQLEAYNTAMYTAMWVDQKDIAQPDVIQDVLTTAGLDAAAMGDAIQQQDIKQALIDATNAAVESGVFGAPTMIIGDEMHFGQDRLDWVERALAA
ncbi:MAG: 2-hydroxychromene-2-carboxylate isomerase [Pseudomonadota bacterium]